MPIIFPEMFEFAAPPKTGVQWFVQACQEADLPFSDDSSFIVSSFVCWPKDSPRDLLRVSLVRHPCDWLRSMFDEIRDTHLASLSILKLLGKKQTSPLYGSLPTFDRFVTSYLEHIPGSVGRSFNSYKCDSRLRLEDMPWALVELLETLGVKRRTLDRVIKLDVPSVDHRSWWRPDLRQRVLEAEAEICRELDYY